MYDTFKEGHVTDCHIVIFQFLIYFWVAIKDKTTKFYFKSLHNSRQIHAFFVNWFIKQNNLKGETFQICFVWATDKASPFSFGAFR